MFTIRGVSFRVVGLSAAIAGGRMSHAVELTAACSWSDVQGLVGADVPGIGTVAVVGAPRNTTLASGTPVNLVIG